MSGWYRMHRGWMAHAVFRDEEYSRRDAFLWMIEEAAFKPTQVHGPTGTIALERGQFSHSLRYMAAAWKWTEPRVRRYLKSTQDAKIIDAATVAGQSVITICNYDLYQATPKDADAGSDAGATQGRRDGDAKKKEGKKKEEEREGANAPRDGGDYAFAGRVIRLNRVHHDEWEARYHAIPDFHAELASLDAWYAAQPDDVRKGWFHRAQSSLNRKHQECVKAGTVKDERSQKLQNVFEMADAAERRRLRWEQSQREHSA